MKIARYSGREIQALRLMEERMLKDAPAVSVIQKQIETQRKGESEDFARLKRLSFAALKGRGPSQAGDIFARLQDSGLKDIRLLAVSKALWALCEDGAVDYTREKFMNSGGGGAMFYPRDKARSDEA
jgi:hypothetical protein